MSSFFNRFWKDQSGAATIEYGLIVGLIALVIITAATALGARLSTAFTAINGKLP